MKRTLARYSGGGRVFVTYLQALKLLANPPLQATENGARCELKPTINYDRTSYKS